MRISNKHKIKIIRKKILNLNGSKKKMILQSKISKVGEKKLI